MNQYVREKKGVPHKKSGSSSFPIINTNAAGIDVGSGEHWVAVPEDRDEEPIRSFGCFTPDLHAMARWLKQCGITTVAMESTGVYWIPAYQILEQYGFEVRLVNATHVKHVPGRKSDVADCQWIQRLHTFGLLSGSFRPDNQVCVLRSYWRHRENLVRYAADHIRPMQKALIQMNLQLHKVLSDITGVTGLRIIRAIVQGERDPQKLARMREPEVKNTPETRLSTETTGKSIFLCSSRPSSFTTFTTARSRPATSRLNAPSIGSRRRLTLRLIPSLRADATERNR